MVTFNCEVCNDTVPKKNTEKHYYRCPNAYYTCIDCNTTFDDGVGYKKHTQCISEDEKYQKALYKGKKAPGKKAPAKQGPVKQAPAKETPAKQPTSLYKVLKKCKSKDDKKKLLKQILVTADGRLELPAQVSLL
ncbi:LAMI_0A01156g1_1 [Lachancea mirantina]|uniref:LAMI_0A01156g1_1 n=1 Tax=Lachancea mirantina TaxID=1230905 RepID=A0A1G4IM08_9SACH|nr:LAMI_0A01156g1_1 [Lachancea mirantina]